MGGEPANTMNFAAALDQEKTGDGQEKLDSVELDGLVVLKIVKHCKEHLPQLVTGQLLGLDYGGTLEVTNCFPFPSSTEGADEELAEDGAEYQYDMMRCLREVNVDNNTVGWYQSTYLGSHITESMVTTQYSYQESIPKCVCLVFDPLQQSQGKLGIRALRLSHDFMELYKGGEFTLETITKASLSWEEVFEEFQSQSATVTLSKDGCSRTQPLPTRFSGIQLQGGMRQNLSSRKISSVSSSR